MEPIAWQLCKKKSWQPIDCAMSPLPRGFRVDKVAIYYAYIPSVHPLNKGNAA